MEEEMMGASGISWTICESFAPHSRHNRAGTGTAPIVLQAGCPYC